ncbi:suppressor of fused domain protein [Paenibacillus guangzhouensis]|uniref:suppressor of fused domain protein n=1 Tax=Paenibacillus guangzhouensis TaxID=1473112 RepID=UPI001266CB5F|nr:suppressor of fused domain protein [Paenibacillus guangzhouensis]
MTEEVNTTGWDAIDEILQKRYGEQEPKHYGTVIPYALGGDDPLDGISVYASDSPEPHWHFVTYGFSELYDKEQQDADTSGYGFELTFRLTRSADEEEPPAWALNLLQNMGRYVFRSGNVFRAGDYLDANGPICLHSDTLLMALSFIEDPELSAIDTPNGRVEFLQMVGITVDELEAMQTWNTLGVLNACKPYMPLYITDLSRESLLQVESIASTVQLGLEAEGSNTGYLFVEQLNWEAGKKGWLKKSPDILTLGAKQAGIIGTLLQGRIPKGKDLMLIGPEIRIVFQPGEHAACNLEDGEVHFTLNENCVTELRKLLQPEAGIFAFPFIAGTSIRIDKTEIKDQEGNVVEIIG